MSNAGFPYATYRRDKSGDVPPGTGYEWTVITHRGYIVDTLFAFSDDHLGWSIAHNIAERMNAAFSEGEQSLRKRFHSLMMVEGED